MISFCSLLLNYAWIIWAIMIQNWILPHFKVRGDFKYNNNWMENINWCSINQCMIIDHLCMREQFLIQTIILGEWLQGLKFKHPILNEQIQVQKYIAEKNVLYLSRSYQSIIVCYGSEISSFLPSSSIPK